MSSAGVHEDDFSVEKFHAFVRVQNTGFVFFTSSIGLNRVGKFTLRITVTDRSTNQSTKLEVPVTVTAP